jgi:hypothetical protein
LGNRALELGIFRIGSGVEPIEADRWIAEIMRTTGGCHVMETGLGAGLLVIGLWLAHGRYVLVVSKQQKIRCEIQCVEPITLGKS